MRARLKEAGIAFICCSSGGNDPAQKVPLTPGYQVPFAERIRREAGSPTRAVGLIDEPPCAEAIVARRQGRPGRARPRHPCRPALAVARRGPLGAPMHHVQQYARAVPMVAKWAAPAARHD